MLTECHIDFDVRLLNQPQRNYGWTVQAMAPPLRHAPPPIQQAPPPLFWSFMGDASMILTHGFTSTWKANIISVHHHLAPTVGASEHLNSLHPFTLTMSP